MKCMWIMKKISRDKSEKLELIEREYHFGSMLDYICTVINVSACEKQLPLIMEVDNTIPEILYGDDVKLRQVLINLLTNAVKCTSSGFIKCIIRSENHNDKVKIHFQVRDTGKEIKKKDIHKLSEEIKISARFLKLMGSELLVQSEYSKGNNLQFVLEQKMVKNTPIDDTSISVLVIDDNHINVKIFKSILKNYNMVIHEGNSGEECLKMLELKKYDIVFLDHMMPNMDGIETIRIHKKNYESINKDTPIIALTANAVMGAREEYIKEGFSDYLTKPIDVEKLNRIIEENCR